MSNSVETIMHNVVAKGSDVAFLTYIHNLLAMQGEELDSDTMYRLRNIIMKVEPKQKTKKNYKNASFEDFMNYLENEIVAKQGK